jgi:hypothetical protein
MRRHTRPSAVFPDYPKYFLSHDSAKSLSVR